MKYALAILLFVTACEDGSPTGATCPTTDPPTYASFGQQFMQTYCTGCHSASAANRHGAPKSQNFDTEADVKEHLDDIDVEAAKGPEATNTAMPERGGNVQTMPTDAEREKLAQFLACERAAQ